MSLKALQEMLELNEAGIVANIKGGYDRTMSRYAKAEAALKKSQEPAEDGEDSREAEATSKVNLQDDLSKFVEDFFTKFPNYGGTSPEDLAKRYPTQEARQTVQDAFKAVATRIEALRNGLNRSVVSARLVKTEQIRKFNLEAKAMMGANAPAPHRQLVLFVKNESKFFKRLIRVKQNGELNNEDFKQLLELKMKQTAPERVPDAVRALNLLFGYMTSQFNAHARVISGISLAADDEARQARLAARERPAA